MASPMQIVPIQRLIDSAHESREQGERYHLGASLAGHHCSRYIWLKFRWALDESKNFKATDKHLSWGQRLRLFRRGHNEEDTVVDDLRAAGFIVTDQQKQVDLGGHMDGSHHDGRISDPSGKVLPPGTGLLEVKTHSLKSFELLLKKGMEESKPMHMVQTQCYMEGDKLPWALYLAVCKDDDRVHAELVTFDPDVAFYAIKRAKDISVRDNAPRLQHGATWWECKMCDAYDFCHVSKKTKEVNCRTCALSTATPEGTWTCEKYGKPIPNEYQRKGCEGHVLHPDLVPWKMESIGEPHHVAYDGRINGGPELDGAVSSLEILG